MLRRLADVRARGLPYLVAEDRPGSGAVLGFAYAGPYRARPAYRYALEDSVYVLPGGGGRGIGSALLGALIERCTALGYRQMIAVIGDSANAGRSEEHTSELQSLMRISYAVFCLKKHTKLHHTHLHST